MFTDVVAVCMYSLLLQFEHVPSIPFVYLPNNCQLIASIICHNTAIITLLKGATMTGEVPFSVVAVNSAIESPQLLTQFGSAATSQIKFTCSPGFALNPKANNSEFNLGTSGSGYITLLPYTNLSQQFIIQTSVFVSGVSFQYCLKCSPGFYSEGYTVNASRTPREQW
jgi:hypothetical protein